MNEVQTTPTTEPPSPIEIDITAMSSKERTDAILTLRAKMTEHGSSSVTDKEITNVVKMIALERAFTKRTPKNKTTKDPVKKVALSDF